MLEETQQYDWLLFSFLYRNVTRQTASSIRKNVKVSKLLFIIYDKGFKVYLKKAFLLFLLIYFLQCWGMVPGRLCIGRRYVPPICHHFVPAQWKQLFSFYLSHFTSFSLLFGFERKPLTYSCCIYTFAVSQRLSSDVTLRGAPKKPRSWDLRPVSDRRIRSFINPWKRSLGGNSRGQE